MTAKKTLPYFVGSIIAGALLSSLVMPPASGTVSAEESPRNISHTIPDPTLNAPTLKDPTVKVSAGDMKPSNVKLTLETPKPTTEPTAKASASVKSQDGKNTVKLDDDYLKFDTEGLSPEQVLMVTKAAEASKQHIPAAFFRAVGEQESGLSLECFTDDRNGGTDGIYQLNSHEMGKYYDGADLSTDRNNNGIPDVRELDIHTKVAAAYFDDLYVTIMQMRKDNPDAVWAKEMTPLETLAIAHNAGTGGMQNYPNFRSSITTGYLENMRTKIPLYSFGKYQSEKLVKN